MIPLRPRRLSASVAVFLYALSGCGLAISQYLMLAPQTVVGAPDSCSVEGLAATAADGLGIAQAMAARAANLRYGPGGRRVPIASESILQGLAPVAASPVGPTRCGRTVARA
jgi:hypothetical protein